MSARIVVCDDEAHITRAVHMKLSKAGFTVQSYSNGQAGWDAVRLSPPDLVITDYQMPHMNGLEFVRAMREHETTQDIPVLLLTAKGFELDHQQLATELGIAAIVVKPFSPRELLKTVERLVGTPAVVCD